MRNPRDVLRIEVPWEPPVNCNPNRRAPESVARRLRNTGRDACHEAASALLLTLDGGRGEVWFAGAVEMVVTVEWSAERKVWDRGSLAIGCKGVVDGLVRAGVIVDDGPGVVVRERYEQLKTSRAAGRTIVELRAAHCGETS